MKVQNKDSIPINMSNILLEKVITIHAKFKERARIPNENDSQKQ